LKAPPLAPTRLRIRINDAAFYFVRQLVAGQIKGFENFKVDKQNYIQTIEPNDLQINDRMLEAFRNFVVNDKENELSLENINSQTNYARTRLREELATANYSTEAGVQVLLEQDPQVLKAIDAIPEARKLSGSFTANK